MMNENEILASKLDLIAKAIIGEIEIEMPIDMNSWIKWYKLNYDSGYLFKTDGVTWNIEMLLECDIREVVKIPLLTDEECVYLSFYPQEWYVSRDSEGSFIVLRENKPEKDDSGWSAKMCNSVSVGRGIQLSFSDIKHTDKYCYTVGELIAYSKEKRK